jgi:hypothetical protein
MERVDYYLERLDRQYEMNEKEFPKAPYRVNLCSSCYNIFFKEIIMMSLPLSLKPIEVDEIVFNLNAAYLMGWLKC